MVVRADAAGGRADGGVTGWRTTDGRLESDRESMRFDDLETVGCE